MYSARITRDRRTAFVFLCDQSGSMTERIVFQGSEMHKSEAVATIMNMAIEELANRCRREDGIRDYFDIAVAGYSGDGIRSLLCTDGTFASITELVRCNVPIKRRHILRILPGGNQLSATVDQRQWITPAASGNTPMLAALEYAEHALRQWCSARSNRLSYPPTVINITDGEASDADDEQLLHAASRIKSLSTHDGNALLFNIHLAPYTTDRADTVSLPCSEDELPNVKYASLLYNMSSVLPTQYSRMLSAADLSPRRAVCYNCPADELFSMLAIGTASSSMTL